MAIQKMKKGPPKLQRRRSLFFKYWTHVFSFFLGCLFTSLGMTVFLYNDHFSSKTSSSLSYLHATSPVFIDKEHILLPDLANKNEQPIHDVAGLDCSAHGGPSNAQEMVYWKDITGDSDYVSPFFDPKVKRYLTFEPDGGGWNNIRMAMETVLAIAVATGRTLVLPPDQRMYLLGQSEFSFADFFPIHSIAAEHPGLNVITTKQFLEETYGKVVDRKTNQIVYPPMNRTNFDGDTGGAHSQLNPFLRRISYLADWSPEDCLAVFPKSKQDEVSIKQTFDMLNHDDVNNKNSFEKFINNPTPVNATLRDRMEEFLANRHELCLYDHILQEEKILHFAGKKALAGGRLLVHFYSFLFFSDWREDLWMKRFIRDHVRYIDDIQCAAARIVEAVRERAKKNGNPDGKFDSFHIRRGDFQYKKTRVSAKEILNVAKDQIPQHFTVYVATDERKKEFFREMKEYGWDLVYLDDYMHLLEGIDKNLFGMVDQLVASRGRYFFGCWFSTFSGYITRLRGYHSQNSKAEGYELGLQPDTFFYALAIHKTKTHDYWPVKKLFYAREYPASFRNIDFGVTT